MPFMISENLWLIAGIYYRTYASGCSYNCVSIKSNSMKVNILNSVFLDTKSTDFITSEFKWLPRLLLSVDRFCSLRRSSAGLPK